MKTVFFSMIAALSFSNIAFADGVSDLVEQLSGTDEKYEVVGTICEQAAKLDLEREYPAPRYTVETGISYGRARNTVGELDVVVLDSDQTAVLVAEVKCWKSFSGGLKKARDQRARFLTNAKNAAGLRLWDKTHDGHSPGKFSKLTQFITVAQKGGASAGFDRELNLSLAELMEARQLLLEQR